VSAAGTLADRYCVHAHKQFGYMGAASVALSPQPLLSCASTAVGDATPYESMGCNGGYQAEAWRFLQAVGTADMSADQARGRANPARAHVAARCAAHARPRRVSASATPCAVRCGAPRALRRRRARRTCVFAAKTLAPV
jgi:hypothetical protein